MHRRRLAAATALALLIHGCAPGMDSEQARATKAVNDTFLPYTEIAGTLVTQKNGGLLGSERQILQLLTRRDRNSGALTTHARVGIMYAKQHRHHFDQVRSQTTELLGVRELARTDASFCKSDQGCPHTVDLLIDIPEPQLRAAQQAGYAFRVYSRDGYFMTFQVPPQLIQALFAATDATQRPAAAVATKAPAPAVALQSRRVP